MKREVVKGTSRLSPRTLDRRLRALREPHPRGRDRPAQLSIANAVWARGAAHFVELGETDDSERQPTTSQQGLSHRASCSADHQCAIC